MYQIKIGNMYLSYINIDTNSSAILNDFIDSIGIDCEEVKLFKNEMEAIAIADKIYIALGVKPVVEKVDNRYEN